MIEGAQPLRILWLKAGRILPVDTGGKIRSFHLARQLAARHQLTFCSYYDGGRDAAYDAALGEAFPGAVAVATGAPVGRGAAQGWHYLMRLARPAPYAVSKFAFPEVCDRIEAWDRAGTFDVMVCDFLSATLNFPEGLHTPTVLFQHNVESALWARQARHESHPVKRVLFALEAWKMARYEPRAVRRFGHVVAVSAHDRDLMGVMTRPDDISVVPTGVDLSTYKADADDAAHARAPLVLFIGSMDWEANSDGMRWFCEEAWPLVRARVPEALLRIVGRNPGAEIRALAGPAIEITGTVPSVVPHLREAAVVIVPLRVGGGTRLKIYEAMAAGRVVVATRVGAEGLDVTDGDDILVADTPAAMADAVIRTLTEPERRTVMEQRAADTAARFDWPRVVASFEAALQRARHAMESKR